MKRLSKTLVQSPPDDSLTEKRPVQSGRARIGQLLPALIMIFLTGCSTIYKRVDLGISERDFTLVTYETHFHEVLDFAGPPSRMTAADEGFAFLYEDMLIREWQTGIAGRTGWMQLIKFSFADAKLFRNVAILRFNRQGILISKAMLETKEGLGKAGSLQPLLSVQQIVDTKQFEDDGTDALKWGMDLFLPLPQGLNNNQSLETGRGGFEQSGTSYKVGQQSLEMR